MTRTKRSRSAGRHGAAADGNGIWETRTISSHHYNRSNERVNCVRDDGKPVAGITGDVLHKEIQFSRHLLRVPEAICFDSSIIRKAEHEGCTRIEVYDSDSGQLWSIPLSKFVERAFPVVRGHGYQVACRLIDWSRRGAQPEQPRIVQPPLFGTRVRGAI